MLIAHTSDLHGQVSRVIKKKSDTKFDIWIDTGDFCPDVNWKSRGWFPKCEANEEGQKEFARSVAPDIARWLDGRPFAYVPGNHDMIELEPFLKDAGVNVFRITTKGTEILGKVFAGFPNVGPISGHWNYETEGDEMKEITKKAFEANPDILLVHNPPYNCRDLVWRGERIGNSYLTNMLTYQEHKIRHIFCGHVHENVGHEILLEKVNVYNNATRFALIETND